MKKIRGSAMEPNKQTLVLGKSDVQRGANEATATGIQGKGASKEWNYKNWFH